MALIIDFQGSMLYVADFRSWSIHQFGTTSLGAGPEVALDVQRGTGTYFAYRADEGRNSFQAHVAFDLGASIYIAGVGGGVSAAGKGYKPGGLVGSHSIVGGVEVGGAVGVEYKQYQRALDPQSAPDSVGAWFLEEYNKAMLACMKK